MALSWCKVDAALDGNRKVRRAGRAGREVFLFLLRRIAQVDAPGEVAADELDHVFVADLLMMTVDEAASGVHAAVAAGLIEISDGRARVVGWDDEWGKRPLTEAQRKARQRANVPTAIVTCPDMSRSDRDEKTPCPDSHGSEERRGEEIREDENRSLGSTRARTREGPLPVGQLGSLAGPAWQYALTVHTGLRGELGASAKPWPALMTGAGATELVARIRERLDVGAPEVDIADGLRHVVDVTAAASKRERTLRFFTPSRIWAEPSFSRSAESTVEQALEPRKTRAGPAPNADPRIGRIEPSPASAYAVSDEENPFG